MKWVKNIVLSILLCLFILWVLAAWFNPLVYANSTTSVQATVKISVCGNTSVERGEDCDNADLQGKTCSSLGYTGGTLSCSISCDFNTSLCIVPSINPSNVPSESVSSLLAAGYLVVPQTESIVAASSVTTSDQVTIAIPKNDGTDTVVLPKGVEITRSDGGTIDPTTLSTSVISESSLSGFSNGTTVDGSLQWGIPNTSLEFSRPITIGIYVGTSHNGEILSIVRSTSMDSGWTSDGIVAPATCVVDLGICTFQTSKASYFATLKSNTTTSSVNSTSAVSSSVSSPTSTPGPVSRIVNPTRLSIQPRIIALPPSPNVLSKILQMFGIGNRGKITKKDLYEIVKLWVDSWKNYIRTQTKQTRNRNADTINKQCDINEDNICDIKDFSLLLYYIDR